MFLVLKGDFGNGSNWEAIGGCLSTYHIIPSMFSGIFERCTASEFFRDYSLANPSAA